MKLLIVKMFNKWFCSHKWDTYFENEVTEEGFKHPIKIFHTLICKKCGKITKIEV